MMVLPAARKFIDTDAIRVNYQRLKNICAPAQVLAVVKCNAYGHGIVKTARCLPRADGFAVATVDEAMALRQAGITGKVLVMQGWRTEDDFRLAVAYALGLVVCTPDHLACLQQNPVAQPLRLWVKFDAGMNRLGFATGRCTRRDATSITAERVGEPSGGISPSCAQWR